MNSSKNKKRSQAAAAGALVLAIMLTVSACGDNKQIPGNASANEPPLIDQLPTGSGIIDSGAANNDNTDNKEQTDNSSNDNEANNTAGSSEQDQEGAVHTVHGEYVGLQDSNQVEIITENGAEAFRLTDQVRPVIDTLEPDSKVEISYTVEVIEKETGLKHLWLQSIKIVE